MSVKSGAQILARHRASSSREGFLEQGIYSRACEQGEVGGTSLEWCSKGKRENQFDWHRIAKGNCQASRLGVNISSVETQGEASVSPSISWSW